MKLHDEAERKQFQQDQQIKAFLEEERKKIAAEERRKVEAELKRAAEEEQQKAAAAEAERQKAEASRAAEERPEEKGGEKGKGKGGGGDGWKRPYNASQGGLQASQFRDKMRKLQYEHAPEMKLGEFQQLLVGVALEQSMLRAAEDFFLISISTCLVL